MPLRLVSIQEAGVSLELPFRLADGETEWELAASQPRQSELGVPVEQFGSPSSVDGIHGHIEPKRMVTNRRLELLTVAVEQEYSDTLRERLLPEFADELGIAKSLRSETFHRAEGKGIKQFVGGMAGVILETGTP